MDYEQKYKEILAWARKNKARLNGVPIEDVLPELAESEDERVRKAIIGLIEELQRSEKYFAGVELTDMIAYLEKQKENPKSADSIPSKCASDAKCEDRWHKVADSLPDNGRLVLAQDCLGNTLLARYDGEGNWEVSVYDNNDYYCRNTITKWCEIPSEKQKEQKPEQYSPLCDTIKDKIREYIANHFIADTVVKTDIKSIVKAMEEGVRLGKEEQKPADYDHEMWKNCEANFEGGKKEVIDHPERYGLQKPAEWSEDDERMLSRCVKSIESSKQFADSDTFKKAKDNEIDWLKNRFKSLRPSWKPSEEHLSALLAVFSDPDNIGSQTCQLALTDLYEQLKKLM